MRLHGPLLAMLVSVVLAGAACSGSSGSAPSTPVGTESTLTKADLIRTADAACAVFGHRAVEIFRESSTDPATNAAQWSRAIDLFDRWIARLSALAAPADDRGDWTRFLTLTKTQRTSYVAVRDAYKRDDPAISAAFTPTPTRPRPGRAISVRPTAYTNASSMWTRQSFRQRAATISSRSTTHASWRQTPSDTSISHSHPMST
jgi:hypothetical protein